MEAGLEQERLQQEAELNHRVNEEEVQQRSNKDKRVMSLRFFLTESVKLTRGKFLLSTFYVTY